MSCTTLFGWRVLGSLDYGSAAFSDQAQEVLQGPFNIVIAISKTHHTNFSAPSANIDFKVVKPTIK